MNEGERIGDAERDAAVTSLREHLAVGRITTEEFEERMTQALSAKTAGDLQPMFSDLPGGSPIRLTLPAPRYQPRPLVAQTGPGKLLESVNNRERAIRFLWIAFFVGWFFLDVPFLAIFVPIIATAILRGQRRQR